MRRQTAKGTLYELAGVETLSPVAKLRTERRGEAWGEFTEEGRRRRPGVMLIMQLVPEWEVDGIQRPRNRAPCGPMMSGDRCAHGRYCEVQCIWCTHQGDAWMCCQSKMGTRRGWCRSGSEGWGPAPAGEAQRRSAQLLWRLKRRSELPRCIKPWEAGTEKLMRFAFLSKYFNFPRRVI